MTLEAIARAWQASPHWGGWRVGMVTDGHGVIVKHRSAGAFVTSWFSAIGKWFHLDDEGPLGIPDLNHPGTRAYLLEDVRKAWGQRRGIHIRQSIETAQWACHVPREGGFKAHPFTEESALLAALLAAPEAA